jgi:hypothetical protein
MAVATVDNSIYIVDLILYGIYTLLPNRNIPLSVFIRDVSGLQHPLSDDILPFMIVIHQ